LFQVSPWLIAAVTIFITGLLAFVIHRVIWVYRRQASTGREELIGKTAVVKVALEPEGTVLFKGERWSAVSKTDRVEVGDTVIINKIDSLKLYVTKKE
jgi:membrane-bound ClpP family serine protease